jgi:hypothetical protein
MGRVFGVTLLLATLCGVLAVAGTAGGAGGSPAPAAFRLADGSAACAFDGDLLACRGRDATSAVVLRADGSSEADAVDVAWNDTTPVLRPTESWWHGGFACRVDDNAIVCDRERGSITVAAATVGGASSALSTEP